ncbi:hypothetical protein O9993_10220 [Vibrio lentus]|nr:hypothetical protein [Vibrio lentus]
MLWYVVLPQLRPATFIAAGCDHDCTVALRSFDLVATMTAGGPWELDGTGVSMYEGVFNYQIRLRCGGFSSAVSDYGYLYRLLLVAHVKE